MGSQTIRTCLGHLPHIIGGWGGDIAHSTRVAAMIARLAEANEAARRAPSCRDPAADVAGYSRLIGADEEGTHERLTAHFRELVDSKIKEHRGRTVKNTGDGMLAEFPSIVDAVRWRSGDPARDELSPQELGCARAA